MSPKTKSVLLRMIIFTIFLGAMMSAFLILYNNYQAKWMLTVAITFLTFFYHFSVRLLVGEAVEFKYGKKKLPMEKMGFRLYSFEEGLYRALKVKKWKSNMITAKPEQFDLRLLSPEAVLHNMMKAELVHRIIMVLSFVPLLFIIPFGAPVVFILTSVFACSIDCMFVMIQRYNRPRVVMLIKSREENDKKMPVSGDRTGM